MKVLFIADGSPFPPQNGVQLPLARIIEYFSTRVSVDLLIAGSGDVQRDASEIPDSVRSIYRVEVRRSSSSEKLKAHLDGVAFISNRYSPAGGDWEGIDEEYDWTWISPISLHSLFADLRVKGKLQTRRWALGQNDMKYHLYYDSINELKYGTIHTRYITDWAKSFAIKAGERKLLESADLVHIQTQKEKQLAVELCNDSESKFIVAKNGVNETLFDCAVDLQSKNILYMTHLHGGRLNESKWFITKVWPEVKERLPDARLVIGGKPPKRPISYLDDARIDVLGYVESLEEVYANARIVVVPTFHGTGLINRIQDALAAGVPTVSTPQAISTFVDLESGRHILSAQDKRAFVESIVGLYNDEKLRLELSHAGRQFVKDWSSSWNETGEVLLSSMMKICQDG